MISTGVEKGFNKIQYLFIIFPWRRKWQSTPGLLPGKSHGQRSLVGYSPWGRKESDMTERLNNNNKMTSEDKNRTPRMERA